MGSVTTQYIARGRVDEHGCLVQADEPLASLQRACGGDIGGTLAIPELDELAAKARHFGFRIAREFSAIDGEERIAAWVEIDPLGTADSGLGGCEIGVVSWHGEPLPPEDDADTARRKTEIFRQLAEFTARLDPEQQILSADTEAGDLAQLQSAIVDKPGAPWTDFVEFPGNAHEQPMHWRLLDGARCTVPGSARVWTAYIEPLGQPDPGSAGFVLYLSAETPLLSGDASASNDAETGVPSLGRDLSPVLRQPINRIIANAETIRTRLAGPLADEYSDYASDIAVAGQHLLSLVDDLSDLEVVELGDFATAPDRIDLGEVARQACGILSVRARERDIQLVSPVEGESELAIAEFRRVLQILINLVGNAIRYSPESSQVWVRLDRIGERAMVTVADQGHGLKEGQQAKIFDKFERLGRSGDGGSGLGLYISRRIARAMDGDLTVESAPGQGARFTLSLPAADERRAVPRTGPGAGIPPPG